MPRLTSASATFSAIGAANPANVTLLLYSATSNGPDWANAYLLKQINGLDAFSSYFYGSGSAIKDTDDYLVVSNLADTPLRSFTIYNLNSNASPIITLSNPWTNNAEGDHFGAKVAISNNTLVVSSPGYPTGNYVGRVYVYRTTTGDWSDTTLVHTINNPDYVPGNAYDTFGGAIAIDGDYIVATAHREGDGQGGLEVGVAYIINAVSGSVLRTIVDPNLYGTRDNDRFGSRCDISGNYAIVSALQEKSAVDSNVGAAYIINVTTGAVVKSLASPSSYFSQFGSSVAIKGNYCVVGAPHTEWNADRGGRAYVYKTTTGDWTDATLLYTLVNPNVYSTTTSDRFGEIVDMNDNFVVVSAPGEDNPAYTSWGAVYVFSLATGSQVRYIEPPLVTSGLLFGAALTLGTNRIMIATERDRVYVYEAP